MAAKTDPPADAPPAAPRSLRPATRVFLIALLAAMALLAWYATQHPARHDVLTPQSLDYRVNVNTADAAALQLLPRIGPSTAQRLIDHREANGPFNDADDLEQVPRIGPKTRAQLELWITFEFDELVP